MSPQISLPTELALKMPDIQFPDMTFNPTFSPAFSPVFSPTLPELNPTIQVTVEPTPLHFPPAISAEPTIVNVTNVLPWKPVAIICFLNTLVFASLSYLIHWLIIFRQ